MKKKDFQVSESTGNTDATKLILKELRLALLVSLAPLAAFALGCLIDYFAGTKPSAMLTGSCLGSAAVVVFVVWRLFYLHNAKQENKK